MSEKLENGKLGLSADEVLTTTRSVRKRLDLTRPVEREVLMECIDIAHQVTHLVTNTTPHFYTRYES